MATVRSRVQLPMGSAQWINDENDQVAQFCAQEAEDFVFSARNEVEWLNEHMAEVFSKNQVNVTEIFKTPGKLRGKTPRIARKRNPLEAREPLTDIFSTNARSVNSPALKASPVRTAPTFQVAEDPVAPSEVRKAAKANTDSGYHGLSEDDMEIDQVGPVIQSSAETHDTVEISPDSPLAGQAAMINKLEGRSTTETSFHSAREEITKRDVITAALHQEAPLQADVVASASSTKNEPAKSEAELPQHEAQDAMDLDEVDKDSDEDLVVDESRSPSQGSSPTRPIVRKSSLTFAALPAREPLTTKKSLGARVSRTSHLDQSKAPVNRGSFLGRLTGGKSSGGFKQPESTHEKEDLDKPDADTDEPTLTREESDRDSKMFKLHNKSSTQRLHDRINMLGKSQNARPTKSIPASVNVTNPSYPQLPNPEPQPQITLQTSAATSKPATIPVSNDEDDDDWIQPPQLQPSTSNRPQLSKSVSADVMEGIRGKQTISGPEFDIPRNDRQATKQLSPQRQTNATQLNGLEAARARSATESASPSRPNACTGADMPTTPVGSPSSSKRYVDGPLSASKSKLQSIMKTARGLFSSSAGVSAQAKMETLSPSSMELYSEPQGPSISSVLESKASGNEGGSRSPMINPAGRKTRSSTEKEERRKQSEAKERQRTEAEAERVREQQSQNEVAPRQMPTKGQATETVPPPAKATRQSPRKTQNQELPKPQVDVAESEQPPQSMGPPQQSQLQKKDPRRPVKPAKEAGPKPKPQPVAIRVGTLSQGIRLNNSALSSSLQESLPPPQPRQPAVAKKPSNASIQSTASNASFKSSVTSMAAKPKALIAAERKKEQDERETQRKLEQKREMERKRAAQQEEARRQEQMQRQEAERQRERERSAAAEDPRNIAKRQAIEKRRLEMQKKDQQRAPQRPAVDHAPVPHQAQTASTTRQELGGTRPPSRLQNLPDHNRLANNHPMHNPSKSAVKRVFDPDADDEPPRPVRIQGGPPYQQNEAKRRKTEDEDLQEVRVRPTMAPPIRQSGIRQGGPKASIFNNSYSTAPPPAPHHNAPSLLKSTTANQAYQQHAHQTQTFRPGHHHDIVKYQNGNIPFAEALNPPQQTHKTPLHSKLAPPAKSSPQYINGENIHLDDIPTESEDESDSDSGSKPKPANLPEWAQSPQLRQLLMTQDETMDADTVFGPVPSPRMEEMFRERHHRFRSRTSSANWAGSDRLTEEEIRRDVEARQRLRREGGWTFGL